MNDLQTHIFDSYIKVLNALQQGVLISYSNIKKAIRFQKSNIQNNNFTEYLINKL